MNDKIIPLFLDFVKQNWDEDSSDLPSFTQIYEISQSNEPILISETKNEVQDSGDITQHSEILAIQKVQKLLNTRYLSNCILITALEPCSMCSGAIQGARIKEVVYLAEQTRHFGISQESIESIYKMNYFPKIIFRETGEIQDLFKKFFQRKRD